MVFNMLKPFLTPEVRDGVVFHSGNLTTLRSVWVCNRLIATWVAFFVKLSQKIVFWDFANSWWVFSQGMRQFDRTCKFLQSRFLLEGWHIRPTPTFLGAPLLQYHEQQRYLRKVYPINEVFQTGLYCRDYVPLDILPSDVGGNKNAPLMVSLPHDSFLLNVGRVSLPE